MKKIWKIFWGVIFLAVCSGCGIKKEQKKTIEDTKEKIYRECEMLAEGYRNIYENAVKENALYELSTIQKSMDYFGKYGYAVIDSYNQLDMVQSIKVDDFLKKAEKVSIPIEISILFGNSEHPFPERKNMPFRSRVQPFI